MKINEYQQLAARTINPTLTPDEVRQHALHEMSSELGEIHDIFQKHLQGHPIDPAALKYEIGDLLWACPSCVRTTDGRWKKLLP